MSLPSPTAQLPSLPRPGLSLPTLPLATPVSGTPFPLPTATSQSPMVSPPVVSPVSLPVLSRAQPVSALPTVSTAPPALAALPMLTPMAVEVTTEEVVMPSPEEIRRSFALPLDEMRHHLGMHLNDLEERVVEDTEMGRLFKQGHMLEKLVGAVDLLPAGATLTVGGLTFDRSNTYDLLREWEDKFNRLMM